MTRSKRLAIVLIPQYADWEYGLLAGAGAQWFDFNVTMLTPGGEGVASMAGLRVEADGAVEMANADNFDAVALVGSDGWAAGTGPNVSALLLGIHEKGGVVGAICGGTVALARSGLLAGRAHTSNGKSWLNDAVGDYAGADLYQDTPAAVSDDHVVTAAGTAPHTFAAAMFTAMMPDKAEQVAQMLAMMATEHTGVAR